MRRPAVQGSAVLVAVVVVALAASLLPAAARAVAGRDVTGQVAAAREGAQRPNVVVLMADDMRAADLPRLPRTRRLVGEEGLELTDAISPHPLCCPARAGFLTGQLAQNNGVRANAGHRWGGYRALDAGGMTGTLPVWLQAAGYRTAFLGKHLNGYSWADDGRDPGWDVFSPLDRHVYAYDRWSMVEDDRVVARRGYVTDFLADRARRTVRDLAADDRPFFLWLSQPAPHSTKQGGAWRPPRSSPAYAGRFDRLRLDSRTKPSYLQRDLSDVPGPVRARRAPSTASLTELHRARARALASLDDANAEVLRALARSGELDDTVVVVTSDNGYLLGEHRLTGKIVGYEESLRVPLLVRGPGVPRGRTSAGPATLVDLTATVVDLAGARPDHPLDGRSLVPVLHDPTARRAGDTQLVQGGPRGPRSERWGWLYRGVRTDRWTLLRYGNGDLELYDRDADPAELRNRAGDPAYAAVEDELVRRLEVLEDCAGSACTDTFGPVPAGNLTRLPAAPRAS